MALMRLKIDTEYEIPDVDMLVQYGTSDPSAVAQADAESFQQDPAFVAEFIAEHAETTEIRVEVVIR